VVSTYTTIRTNPNANVLLVEDLSTDRQGFVKPGDPSTFATLVMPAGAAALERTREDSRLRFVPFAATSEAPPLAVFESVRSKFGDVLLLLTPPGSGIRRNGLPAPVLGTLALGDRVTLDADITLHVSRMQSAEPVPPPPEIIGEPCAVCSLAFEPQTLVLLCAYCGEPHHLESEAVPAATRLECALLGACSNCGRDLPRTTGLVHLPED